MSAALDRRTADALLDLTHRMHRSAKAADWERVAFHDAERHALLTGAPDATEGTREAVPAGLVAALREADRDVLACAREARDSLGKLTSRTRAERDVCRTYADVMKSVGALGSDG